MYPHSSIILGDCYAVGNGWIAFNAKFSDKDENLIVKRYKSADIAARKVFMAFLSSCHNASNPCLCLQAMHEDDIRAFKQNWFVFSNIHRDRDSCAAGTETFSSK